MFKQDYYNLQLYSIFAVSKPSLAWSWAFQLSLAAKYCLFYTLYHFIYILDSSNSSSFTFWSSTLASSSRSNWTGIWTSNSNDSWTDKHSSHFSTAKEIKVQKLHSFWCKNHNKQILKWCWNDVEILLN